MSEDIVERRGGRVMDDDIRRARELVADMGRGNGAGDILARAFMKSQAEIERLRAERNLLREMFNSAEQELAAERERCAKIVERAASDSGPLPKDEP